LKASLQVVKNMKRQMNYA